MRYVSPVEVLYYTDPICPWSWALEPAVRTLTNEFGDSLQFTYVMCGMMREPADALSQIGEALEASSRSGMPVDPRLWLDGPPSSSYPACIAVKAVAEQVVPEPYIRRLREGFLCRRRKLDGGEALVEEARMLGGLDIDRLRIDLASHATLEAFGADLDRAAAVPPDRRAPGTGRVRLPSIEFRGEDGALHGVYGYSDFSTLREAALAAGAEPASRSRSPDAVEALRQFGSMATAEIASVCGLPGPRAPAELWRLAVEWRVRPERVGNGELWVLA